jgi:hypothetical protein
MQELKKETIIRDKRNPVRFYNYSYVKEILEKKFSVSGVPIREEVELRISFNLKTRLALIRFWYQDKLVGQQQVKAEDLKKVHV